MADLMDLLMQFLCQQNTIGECQQFVSSYTDPIQQLVFFLLFPIVFLVIFVTILSQEAVPRLGKKLGMLFAVAILIFIVVQGYYYIFLTISKLWMYFVVILLGLWIVLKYIIGRKGGGGAPSGRSLGGGYGGGGRGGGGIGSAFGEHATRQVQRVTAAVSPAAGDCIRRIDRATEVARGIVANMASMDSHSRAEMGKPFREQMETAERALDELRKISPETAKTYERTIEEVTKEYHAISKR